MLIHNGMLLRISWRSAVTCRRGAAIRAGWDALLDEGRDIFVTGRKSRLGLTSTFLDRPGSATAARWPRLQVTVLVRQRSVRSAPLRRDLGGLRSVGHDRPLSGPLRSWPARGTARVESVVRVPRNAMGARPRRGGGHRADYCLNAPLLPPRVLTWRLFFPATSLCVIFEHRDRLEQAPSAPRGYRSRGQRSTRHSRFLPLQFSGSARLVDRITARCLARIELAPDPPPADTSRAEGAVAQRFPPFGAGHRPEHSHPPRTS